MFMKKVLKKTIAKNCKILLPLLLVLFILLHLNIPLVNASSAEKIDSNAIDKIVDDMQTLNDLEKENYKRALKNIFTLDDWNELTNRDKNYESQKAMEEAGKIGIELAEKVSKRGAKMFTIVSDGIAWIEASKEYNADPTNAKKDQVYSEKAFRFYNNFLPFGGIVFSIMADTIEGARERVEFEAQQKKIFDKIISDYETRMEMEYNRIPFFERMGSQGVVNCIFGEGQLQEPTWGMLRYFSDKQLEQAAQHMQEYPQPWYTYNTAAFLKMMKNGGPAKEAFLKNMNGGGPAGFAKHSPVYMTITDPFGDKYGVDPETKRLLCDDAAICSPMQKAGDAQYTIIPSIYDGIYQIRMVGYDDGEYNFLFQGFNHNSELQGKIKLKGYIHKGEVLEANLTITLNDQGYEVSEPNFVKTADSYPIPSDPETLLPAIDKDPFEIYFEEPCLSSFSLSPSKSEGNGDENVIMGKILEGVKQDYFICLKKSARPTYTFFTNKFSGLQTINEDNLQFVDEKNNQIKGFYEIKGSTFSFTPNVPIIGEATLILKGGKNGICSKTDICLTQDLEFKVSGLEPGVEWEKEVPFEFIATEPIVITKKLQIINEGQVAKKDITLTTFSYKSFPPNTFFFVSNISSPVPYEIIEGENDLIKFKISELKAQETLNIDLTYIGMPLGIDYFSRLDVNKINANYDSAVLEKFTRAGAGIEVEDPKIKELAQKIVGEEKNPFWKAYKIYNWITRTITYDYEKAERVSKGENIEIGALLTLQKKTGICDDYTKLFLALARAAGIPARFVTLDVLEEKAEGHTFPEIYLPPYGWIPLDPTWGTNFASFARTEPGLAILIKEDGLTKSKYFDSSLEGGDTQGIEVISSLEGGILTLIEGKDWDSLFNDHFFGDIHQLTFTSEINNQLSQLENYNQGLGQQLFTLAEKPKTSVVITAQQALEAYQNNNYNQVRPKVQKVIKEQLQVAATSFSLLAQKLQEYVEGPSSTQSMLLYGEGSQEGHKNPTQTEVLQQINQTKKDMDFVKEQAQAGNYYTAVKSLVDSYSSTSLNYLLLINDIAVLKIKNLILSPENIFRFNWGTVSAAAIILVFIILLPILWFWMWINCLVRKEFRHLNKIWWFLIVFFICFPIPCIPIGAMIYFFVEYRKRKALVNDSIKNNKIITKRKDNSK